MDENRGAEKNWKRKDSVSIKERYAAVKEANLSLFVFA